jgi:hypothetical protein
LLASRRDIDLDEHIIAEYQIQTTCFIHRGSISVALNAPILNAFWYSEGVQSRLHPVRGKGRSHLNQLRSPEK